jgi:hypothetical protein
MNEEVHKRLKNYDQLVLAIMVSHVNSIQSTDCPSPKFSDVQVHPLAGSVPVGYCLPGDRLASLLVQTHSCGILDPSHSRDTLLRRSCVKLECQGIKCSPWILSPCIVGFLSNKVQGSCR